MTGRSGATFLFDTERDAEAFRRRIAAPADHDLHRFADDGGPCPEDL